MREEGCERVGGGVIFGGAPDILETRIWYGDREIVGRNLTYVDCVCLRRTSRPSFVVCRPLKMILGPTALLPNNKVEYQTLVSSNDDVRREFRVKLDAEPAPGESFEA